MAKDFRRPDRGQGFLLPPDLREWLPAGHLVWFVIEVVERLDLTGFERRSRLGAAGRAPLDPAMLLTLLLYAYAHGERSSRQIERLCEVDVAFRVICGNEAPDHTTIARFRAAHEDAFAELFTQVLVLCAQAGLGRFGTVAIDGTKIAANASKRANRTEKSLRSEAERILAEAAAVDAAEDEQFGDRRGDELPAEFADPRTRGAAIARALAELAEEQAADGEQSATRNETRVAYWRSRAAASERRLAELVTKAETRWQAGQSGQPTRGKPAVPPHEHVSVVEAQRGLATVRRQLARAEAGSATRRRKASTIVNVTDPQSRLVKTREGFVQGFNAQLAVTDDQLIAAVQITTNSNDRHEFVPMMNAAVDAAATVATATGTERAIGTIVADAGYFSEHNLTAPGPDRLIATGARRRTDRAVAETPTSGPPPADATPLEAMRHRMRDPDTVKIYKRRAVTVEPVNGQLKDRIGLRQFARRGRAAALAELNLGSAVHNLLKLHRAQPAPG